MKIDIQALRSMIDGCQADDVTKWGTAEYRTLRSKAQDLLPMLLDVYEASCKLVDIQKRAEIFAEQVARRFMHEDVTPVDGLLINQQADALSEELGAAQAALLSIVEKTR